MSKRCKECGKYYRWNYTSNDRGNCFHCQFWLDHIVRRTDGGVDEDRSVIVNNVAYLIGEEPEGRAGWGCGHSGREFKIKFFDGREIISHNLWCQGNIDPRFRRRLPDNAEFIA